MVLLMKKFLGFIFLICLWSNYALAEINLSCVIMNWNENKNYSKDQFEIEYTELKPSRFSGIIEVMGPGKVIGRLMGSSETGHMQSPFVGTIDDNSIEMNHKMTKIDERGTDFTLDLITGMFVLETYIFNYKYWWLQKTGTCTIVK
jgi:hypothetical protein